MIYQWLIRLVFLFCEALFLLYEYLYYNICIIVINIFGNNWHIEKNIYICIFILLSSTNTYIFVNQDTITCENIKVPLLCHF